MKINQVKSLRYFDTTDYQNLPKETEILEVSQPLYPPYAKSVPDYIANLKKVYNQMLHQPLSMIASKFSYETCEQCQMPKSSSGSRTQMEKISKRHIGILRFTEQSLNYLFY